MSYPDVVEASMSQGRELERSLQALVDGEINLSTISRALSEASLSNDPQHFVNIIRNSLKAKMGTKDQDQGSVHGHSSAVDSSSKETEKSEEEVSLQDKPIEKEPSRKISPKQTGITTTPKNGRTPSVENVRRNLSDLNGESKPGPGGSLTKPRPVATVTGNTSLPVRPLNKQNSVSEPPTPRDTPTPPLTKSISVPYSLEVSRRRRPSGTRHSSPVKKSPKKVVVKTNTTPSVDLYDLLHEAEVTPSLSVTSRKHLHTSTPFHPNLNLSTVILDNLTRNKSISPFVNPDHSINAVEMDVSTISPEIFTSVSVPDSVPRLPTASVRHVTPKGPNFSEVEIGKPPSQNLNLEDVEVADIFSSHVWIKVKIPIVHDLTGSVQAALKISKVWIGSLEIPEEYWSNVLLLNYDSVKTVLKSDQFVEISVFAKREGAFALNLVLISPGGTSSAVARFQVEEPNLRVLTKNGHTVDFGTVPVQAKTSVPIMVINGGSPTLPVHLEIVSNSAIFSFDESKTEKSQDFLVPGIHKDADTDEGVAKEIKIWTDAGQVSEHPDPRVYSAQLQVKLGDSSSQIVLGTIEMLLRVCFAKLVIKPSHLEEFACGSGDKCIRTLTVQSQGSIPLEVEVSLPEMLEGTFTCETRFKIVPGSSKSVSVGFVSKPGFYGRRTEELVFKMQPGGVLYRIPVQINIIPKTQADVFSESSPGLKLGVMGAPEGNLDRFPVEADRSLVNWFAVEPGHSEEQFINLRNSSNTTVTLNIMIRESESFKITVPNSSETSTKLAFAPKETKAVGLVFSPKLNDTFTGKLVLKPVNMKVNGKIIKASIGLLGSAGCSDIKILDVKPKDETSFLVKLDKEPPTRRDFRMINNGSSLGFVKIICTEELGRESSQVVISSDSFLLKEGESKIISVIFMAGFDSKTASLAIFSGPEIARNVYRRARMLPGATRLSASPALLGVDFTKKIPREEEFTSVQYAGDLTGEDVQHFYNKTEKRTLIFQFPEKMAKFDELAVEETLSETRLEATVHLHSPPTTDSSQVPSVLQITPQTVSLEQGSEAIVKITNTGPKIVHWDLTCPSPYLSCSPPGGQLAKGGQAIILVSAGKDLMIGSQGWRGQAEIFSDDAVAYINVFIKPHLASAQRLLVSPAVVDFGNQVLEFQEKKTLTLSNHSPDMIQWKGSMDPSPFSLGQPAGVLNPGQAVSVPVLFRPSTAGPCRATLHFTAIPFKVKIRVFLMQ